MKTGLFITAVLSLCLISVNPYAIPVDADISPDKVDSKNKREYVLYKSAQKKFSSGDFGGAKQDYLKSLQANPIFFPSMIGMAEIEYNAGNKSGAEAYFTRAFGVTSNSAILHTAYGKFLFKNGDIPGAIKAFEKAIEINPGQADAHTELAVIYLSRMGDTDKAIKHYRQAVAARPDELSLLYGLSAAQSAGGKVDESIATLKEIASKVPQNALPWQYMGVYYARAGRFNEAINALKHSVSKNKQLIDTRWILADIYMQAGNTSGAIAEYQWIADNTIYKDVAYFRQGLVYHANKDYASAEKAYLNSIKFNPEFPDPYNNLAYITLETGRNYAAGLEWGKKAVSLKPDSSIYLDTLGWIYYKLGEYQHARKYLQLAVNSKPVSAEAHYHLGKVYEKLDDKNSADNYFAEAKKIDKNFVPAN